MSIRFALRLWYPLSVQPGMQCLDYVKQSSGKFVAFRDIGLTVVTTGPMHGDAR